MPHPAPPLGGPTARALRWLIDRADRPLGIVLLVVLALLEATVFPAPTEALLLALAIARPRRAWWLGGVAALASAAGGLVGYRLGLALFDEVARPVLANRGLLGQLESLAQLYRGNAFLALASSGYTPIPYMLYTMAAGAFGVPLGDFVLGSVVGRALKYAPLAGVAYFMGPAAHRFIERHAGWLSLVAIALLILFALLSR